MTTRAARPVRARRIEAEHGWAESLRCGSMLWKHRKDAGLHAVHAVVLTFDDEQRLVEQVAQVLFSWEGSPYEWCDTFPCGEWRRRLLERARAVLQSLGLLKGGRK